MDPNTQPQQPGPGPTQPYPPQPTQAPQSPAGSYPGRPQQPGQPPYGGQPPYAPQQGHPGQFPEEDANTVLRSGLPPQPVPPAPGNSKRNLAIVLGSVGALLVIALVAVFLWVVPAFSGTGKKDPVAVTTGAASSPPVQQSASDAPSQDAGTPGYDFDHIPEGATSLPQYWRTLKGPGFGADDKALNFHRFVTGESSFAYLNGWSHDVQLGITKDPNTGDEMQRQAYGTPELDGDGLSMAFSFFAETDEGKFGSDTDVIKGDIQKLQTKLTGMSQDQLAQTLVGHKCSGLTATKPETREFTRSLAVVVGFECKTSRGEQIQGVNLFTVTPWGTPQVLGVSGHKDYWDQHPGLMAQLANSYRNNKWKQG